MFGYGYMNFHMVNMRGVHQFGLFRGGTYQSERCIGFFKMSIGFENPIMAAVSNVVTFSNPNEPLHGHLALTGNETEMM